MPWSVRDGQVTNKPSYVVIGVTTAGERKASAARLAYGALRQAKAQGILANAALDGTKIQVQLAQDAIDLTSQQGAAANDALIRERQIQFRVDQLVEIALLVRGPTP